MLRKMDYLYDFFVEEGCEFLRLECIETSPTLNNNVVNGLYKIMDSFLAAYREDEINKVKEEALVLMEDMIENMFVFSFIWSICCTVDYAGRKLFDVFVRKKISEAKLSEKFVPYPEEGTVYDY